MGDFLVAILELVIAGLSILIYGTEDKPRHPAVRNMVRTIAFGGSAIVIATALRLIPDQNFHWGIAAIWLLSSFVVLIGEYEIGSKRVAYAIYITMVLLIGIGIKLAIAP